ncbi:pirin family protein [Paenibacillus ihbetae]|uniref:Pirin n=1 Tax=Paenibacillus ihbetae TaxID=1870820 RepID=A0A1B2DZ51_9BACL|nr:pirin family protein [Paenibacillus ihbetae]ANY73024.1 pirin [Paenibacillus ihbetae]OOC58936.1 pirin [Paenibacillus ihbetae]
MIGKVYMPENYGKGSLDGGRIAELKPIGLTGEGSAVNRVGPIFYWSWFRSPIEGTVEEHPHQGFEIVTYMIQGTAVHQDSQGLRGETGAGGLQLMRAGSGLTHEEHYTGPDAEGFQIWLEPYLRDSLKQNPASRQYRQDAFPVNRIQGGSVTTLIGSGSPVDVSVDARMLDIQILAGHEAKYELKPGRYAAALTVRGKGKFNSAEDELVFHHRDFVVLKSEDGEWLTLKAQDNLRMILIDVPEDPGYRLYAKRP